uniref:Uncharacterized protein n=1 Tax=Parascaris equorum TaxID=6256 RepID=A0A914S0I9_PAREQ
MFRHVQVDLITEQRDAEVDDDYIKEAAELSDSNTFRALDLLLQGSPCHES